MRIIGPKTLCCLPTRGLPYLIDFGVKGYHWRFELLPL